MTNSLSSSFNSYIKDAKPFRVKLNKVSEQLTFNESVSLKLRESVDHEISLGSNFTKFNQSNNKSGWLKNIVYDGARKQFTIPPVILNRQNIQTLANTDGYKQIPGLDTSLLDISLWGNSALEYVLGDGELLHNGIDYVHSHGIFSFRIFENKKWKQNNLVDFSRFAKEDGEFIYDTSNPTFISISNIIGGDYDDWQIKCIDDNTGLCEVIGKLNGSVGTFNLGTNFSSSKISFFADIKDSSLMIEKNFIEYLTPKNKIAISDSAPVGEIWSLIRVDPISLISKPLLISGPNGSNRAVKPSLLVRSLNLDNLSTSQNWTVRFTSDTTYNVELNGANYRTNLSLTSGQSFKTDAIHFTLIFGSDSFVAGDVITFSLAANPNSVKVYGSISGWQADARVGEWYWNGKIGFKIPEFTADPSNDDFTVYTNKNGYWEEGSPTTQIYKSVSFINGKFLLSKDNPLLITNGDDIDWLKTVDLTSSINQKFFIFDEIGDVFTYDNINGSNVLRKNSTGIQARVNGHISTSDAVVAVTENGKIYVSSNLTQFSERYSSFIPLNDAAFNSNFFVAVGDSGTIIRSSDKVVWTKVNSGISNNLNSVFYSAQDGKFIAVGDGGAILSSVDGQTWNIIPVNSGINLIDVVYGDGKWVAVSGEQSTILESTNGSTWTRYSGPAISKISFSSINGDNKFIGLVSKSTGKDLEVTINVHSNTEPQIYTLTFIDSVHAAVESNKQGFLRGLKVGELWSDGFISFTLDPSTNGSISAGSVYKIVLGYGKQAVTALDYDEDGYDEDGYTVENLSFINLRPYLENHFQFYYGKGAILPLRNDIANFKISKITQDKISLYIRNSSFTHSSLLAKDDWVPIFLVDRNGWINDFENTDLVTVVDAYLCSNKDMKVFTINQPRNADGTYGVSSLTFADEFLSNYVKISDSLKLAIQVDKSYGQKVNISIAENLAITERIVL